jgi:hypothetical protein
MNATSPQQIRFMAKQLDLVTEILTREFGPSPNFVNYDHEAAPFLDGVRFDWLSEKGKWLALRYRSRRIR